jgi:hypothetical protein
MTREKISKSRWALAGADPRFNGYGQSISRSIFNCYGFIDPFKLLACLSGEQDCYTYFKFQHALCSRRIAQLKAAERRPKYYEAENARRRQLAAERRKLRTRATTNMRPTREAIREAWNHRRDSHAAAIRFGSLLEDLECYIDNSLRRDGKGGIIGRNAGIKGWLFDNLPEIFDMYTTAMRYKAAAKKLKQVTELSDPIPAEAALPQETEEQCAGEKCDYGANENDERRKRDEIPALAVVRARAVWTEVVNGIGSSVAALMRRLDALLDPTCVEDANMLAAWRERYANEITERTKKRWWRRIVRAAKEQMRKTQNRQKRRRHTLLR